MVVVATGARPARPWWAGDDDRVVDVRDVLEGRVHPEGRVVVVDELGFHQATSTAELLADRGCAVEIVTNGMVVGQDLGITLDMETWNVKAHRLGHRPERRPGADGRVPTGRRRSARSCSGSSTTRPAPTRSAAATGWSARSTSSPRTTCGGPSTAPRSRSTGSATAWLPDGPTPPSSRATGWRWRCDRSLGRRSWRAGRTAARRARPRRSAEAGGRVVVVGDGAEAALRSLPGVTDGRWAETGPRLPPRRPGRRPRSGGGRRRRWWSCPPRPTGATWPPAWRQPPVGPWWPGPCRPRSTGRPGAGRPSPGSTTGCSSPSRCDGPAVVTLAVGGRHAPHAGDGDAAPGARLEELPLALGADVADDDPDLVELLEPDLHTMDLADATRVVAGGAGLVAGLDDRRATEVFTLLGAVAAALGGSAGATRVATDAGWTGYERQIGTTGVTVDPDLYVALGVSGAAQHIGGLGAPRHVVSVNTDPSCPMTAMADLGLVTDAGALLAELARRLGVGSTAPCRRSGGTVPEVLEFDAVVVGAGPAGVVGRPGPGPGRPVGGPGRAGPVPRVEERLRRRRLRAGARRHRPRTGGRRCRSSGGWSDAPP